MEWQLFSNNNIQCSVQSTTVTFNVNNLTGSYSITSTNPFIQLDVVSNHTYGTLSYSWTTLSFTANTSSASITQAGTISVKAYDPNTGFFSTQTPAIGIDTLMPTNNVNLTSQIISRSEQCVQFC